MSILDKLKGIFGNSLNPDYNINATKVEEGCGNFLTYDARDITHNICKCKYILENGNYTLTIYTKTLKSLTNPDMIKSRGIYSCLSKVLNFDKTTNIIGDSGVLVLNDCKLAYPKPSYCFRCEQGKEDESDFLTPLEQFFSWCTDKSYFR